MLKVKYTNPGGRVLRTRLALVVEDFEDEHGKPPPGFGDMFIDITALPLDDQTGFTVSTMEGQQVIDRLPAQYEGFVKGVPYTD